MTWRDVFSTTPPILGRLIRPSLWGCSLIPLPDLCLLGVLDKQPADEVLGQLTSVAKVLLVEVIVHSRDVGQGLLLGLTQEWGCTTQTGRQTWGSVSPALTPSPGCCQGYHQNLQCPQRGQTQRKTDAGPMHTFPWNLQPSTPWLPTR